MWIGRSKETTTTGALRLKDIEAAAATLGVRARGVLNAKRRDEALPGFAEESETDDEGRIAARSMHEVPILNAVWATLSGTGILEVRPTVVVPGGGAVAWLEGGPEERVLARRKFLTGFLRTKVNGETGSWGLVQPAIAALQMAVLLRGSTPDLLPMNGLRAGKEAVEQPDLLEDFVTDLVYEGVEHRLEELTRLGLLDAGSDYSVPPVVRQCVHAAFGNAGVEHADLVIERTESRLPDHVFQLKVDLQGAKPLIWRRILVPSSMRLSELHEVIQLIFGWMDYHPHQFREGIDVRGTAYGPGEAAGYGEPLTDESTVTVGNLLHDTGDRMSYVYDFGDDWEHRITLEKIDSAAGESLPRCIGGRGAGPAEDSGGTWGWADKVEAANNPTHPEHQDVRDWLGLGPDGDLDPREFDLTGADDALEVLRT